MDVDAMPHAFPLQSSCSLPLSQVRTSKRIKYPRLIIWRRCRSQRRFQGIALACSMMRCVRTMRSQGENAAATIIEDAEESR